MTDFTRVYPDAEFLVEDPTETGLLAYATVDDAGREIYRINHDVDLAAVINEPFLMDEVVPHLPLRLVSGPSPANPAITWPRLEWNRDHPDYAFVKPLDELRSDLASWFESCTATRAYGYYGVDDFARLHRLWRGRWTSMNGAIPTTFQELMTIARALDLDVKPVGITHRAIDDARAHRDMHELLMAKADWVPLL
ncbi:hypothetical protein [Streptomyces albidoflavus]|uniref:hypothetical protein n=1 Tax=Streptomyces albidoflavus TaxID=1886 RepID=UPI00102115CA|nr:hypothetical protein [Streptomyces albidoflavus]RZF02915.1 hypothetical protein C0R05_32405 [Streptomyces albidoflavus]